jgi:ferritin-like metal-binding protein YciE
MPDDTRDLFSPNFSRPGNVGTSERWMSAAAGLGLTLQAMRSRSLLGRLLLASAGFSLLARGATGYCAVKSTLSGDMNLKQGVREQFRRLRETVASETIRSVDSMEALYAAELQELHSAESQLAKTLDRLGPTIQSEPLALRLDEYATEVRARRVDLESLLARIDVDTRAHPDDAMRALLDETEKMTRLSAPTLREAALTASLQRIIHYKIAGYGTIAAYAKALGRTEQASHFAELADRDKVIDGEFTQLAKTALNPKATSAAVSEQPSPPGSARTH